MYRTTAILALVFLIAAACTDAPSAAVPLETSSLAALQGGGDGAYAAQFDDAAGYALRSDGAGAYLHGVNCVHSIGGSAGGGVYQLRTIAATTPCKAQIRGVWRYLKLDFGGVLAPRDLDQDGSVESIEDAPGRILLDDAFAQGASSTPVRVLLFVVNGDGSTTWDTRYELRYRANAAATGTGSRIIEAATGSAAADLYEPIVQGRKTVWSLVATVQLPFKLTLTP